MKKGEKIHYEAAFLSFDLAMERNSYYGSNHVINYRYFDR